MTKPPDPGRAAEGRRRVVDCARALPFIGTFLFLLPAFWSGSGAINLARAGIYVFVVWAMLIGVSAVISRLILRGGGDIDPPEA